MMMVLTPKDRPMLTLSKPAGSALVRRHRGDRVLKSFQIVPDLLEKALAGLGQGQLPGTAVK
jgi:hypothetical protein